jgi:hypothetical protein
MRNSNAHPTVRLKYLPWLLVFAACPAYANSSTLPGEYWNGFTNLTCPSGSFCTGGNAAPLPCAPGLNSPAGVSECLTSYPIGALLLDTNNAALRRLQLNPSHVTTLQIGGGISQPAAISMSRDREFIVITQNIDCVMFIAYAPRFTPRILTGVHTRAFWNSTHKQSTRCYNIK